MIFVENEAQMHSRSVQLHRETRERRAEYEKRDGKNWSSARDFFLGALAFAEHSSAQRRALFSN